MTFCISGPSKKAELQKSNHKCQTLEEKLKMTLKEKEGENLKELFKKQLVESEIKEYTL